MRCRRKKGVRGGRTRKREHESQSNKKRYFELERETEEGKLGEGERKT